MAATPTSAGVVHRDLKPSNILVIRGTPGESSSNDSAAQIDDGAPAAQDKDVLDFGLARITDADCRASKLVEGGDIRAPVAYMSPEQAPGASDEIDLRSDVYALGVVLYKLIASRFPYDTAGSLRGGESHAILRAGTQAAPAGLPPRLPRRGGPPERSSAEHSNRRLAIGATPRRGRARRGHRALLFAEPD